MTLDELADRLRDDVATRDVELLVLHGSRARGDATPASDWDFAYVGDPNLDVIGLTLAITAALGSDLVDLVDRPLRVRCSVTAPDATGSR